MGKTSASFSLDCLLSKAFPTPECGCWLWGQAVNSNGYGFVYFRGAMRLAHRAAWILVNGDIPQGLSVCHKCDTPSCVNPSHLFLGTPKDNANDKMAKGRHHSSKKKICKNGHPYEGLNVKVDKRGQRYCLPCARESKQAWKRRNKNYNA